MSSSGHACVPVPGTSPTGQSFVAWQLGNGAGAELWQSTMTASGWSDPALLVDPDGPAWLPALCDGVAVWAGTGGTDDWDIFITLEGGMGSGGQETSVGLDFRIMGNPVSSTLHLSPLMVVRGTVPLEILVYDITGRAVSTASAPAWTGTDLRVDCSSLPSGVYVVRVSSCESEWTGRMTVLR